MKPCRRLSSAICLVASLGASSVRAGENIPDDDPAWRTIRDAWAVAPTTDPLGGVQSLSEEEALDFLSASALPTLRAPSLSGFWIRPADRATLRLQAVDELDRPYSLPLRPRNIAGGIATACEQQEGRPCGDGVGASLEIDSAAGFGRYLTLFTRLRGSEGTSDFDSGVSFDRAYLRFQYEAFIAEIGRDVLVLGPSVHNGLQASDSAAPHDGLTLQLRPVDLTSWARVSLLYFISQLRQPQTFAGTLLDCTRIQLDLLDHVQLGGSRLLQLGGSGAPDFGGVGGFILEHFARGPGGAGVENNRLSFDLSVRIPSLRGARIYYEIDFEDTRTPFLNSIRYDADHSLGLEIRKLELGALRRFFFEIQETGWVSQEHSLFRTGMTDAGHTIGTPLGPDGLSVWGKSDFEVAGLLVSPWYEWMRFLSDTYDDIPHTVGVFVTSIGPIEHRQRVGVDVAWQISERWWLSAGAFGEHVGNVDLVLGTSRFNEGVHAAIAFRP